jgi:hypothetical protein
MRKSAWSIVVTIAVVTAGGAFANTSCKKPPEPVTACSHEKGVAYGLCHAYCEALDCDNPSHHASDQACTAVKKNFEKLTGRPLPCAVQCPCAGLLQLFANISSKVVKVQRCTFDAQVLYVVTDAGEYALVSNGPPAYCSVNAEPPFVELSATELLACRLSLQKAAEAQGVVCVPVE